MSHKEKALQYFSDKFHCSQAVLAAFAPELGITEEQALRLGACFGAGKEDEARSYGTSIQQII
ncbi:MAG: C-GCAxxG-C-C family protein [Saccharofermentans sp.]|nr:C-GCAxxG-C-C family protein [Saccharofermentans sp.]